MKYPTCRALLWLAFVAWCGASAGAVEGSAPADAPRPTLTGTKQDWWYFRAIAEAKKLVSPGQTPEEQARADEAWQHLFDPVDGRSLEYVTADGQPSSLPFGDTLRRKGNWRYDPQEYVWSERARRAFRQRGLKFWDDFPKDLRRFVWLFEVSRVGPYYWRNAEDGARSVVEWSANKSLRVLANTPADYDAKARWEIEYLRLRAEFFACPVLDQPTKHALRLMELARRVNELPHSKMPDSLTEAEVALRWTEFCRDVFDFAERAPADAAGDMPSIMFHLLEEEAKYYPEFYPLIRKAFLAATKLSASDSLRDDAGVADEEPVELEIGQPVPGLKFTTLKNETIDRKAWRGKVVLLDYWAFWCHSCIEGMPELKKLYDKYHEQGLEIYGLCFAKKGETPQKIVDLMAKMEIPWPQAMREPLGKDRMARVYRFRALPQLILLDRNGNLAGRNLYDPAQLEAKIQELLAAPSPK